jgi:ABC-type nitrate/sulfonate/bicarbonate transport system substrate-binding protein
MLESHGASRILASFHDIMANWIFAGLYFSETYLTEHPENVKKLMKGLVKSFEFIASDEKEARSFLTKYTNVEKDLCMIAALREYQPVEPLERINEQINLMTQYGYIKSSVPIETMLDYRFIPESLRQLGPGTVKGSEQ